MDIKEETKCPACGGSGTYHNCHTTPKSEESIKRMTEKASERADYFNPDARVVPVSSVNFLFHQKEKETQERVEEVINKKITADSLQHVLEAFYDGDWYPNSGDNFKLQNLSEEMRNKIIQALRE